VTTADPVETGKRNRHPTSTSPTGHKSNRPGDSHGRRRRGTARAWPHRRAAPPPTNPDRHRL